MKTKRPAGVASPANNQPPRPAETPEEKRARVLLMDRELGLKLGWHQSFTDMVQYVRTLQQSTYNVHQTEMGYLAALVMIRLPLVTGRLPSASQN